MFSIIPPVRTITLPPGAGPGQSRTVIGPDLPPPLNTYVIPTGPAAGRTFSGGTIWYGNGDDTTYIFECMVDNGALALRMLFRGFVKSGAVVVTTGGGLAETLWRVDTGTPTPQMFAQHDDITLLGYLGVTLGAGTGNIAMSSTSGVTTSEGDLLGLRGATLNAAASASNSTNSAVPANYPGNPAVTFTKRYAGSTLLVRWSPTFFVDILDTGPQFGVLIAGTDYPTSQLAPALVPQRRYQSYGERRITGIAAGAVTVTGRYARLAGTGSVFVTSGDDWVNLSVQEVAA